VLFAVLMSLLLAFFHLRLKADLILSGIALNILGSAATVAIMFELTGDRGNTQGNLNSMTMPTVGLPSFLGDIPVISFFYSVFNNQNVMTWIAFAAVFVVWYFMYRTPIGMHLRAVGENPEAAASVGIRVTRVRYLALVLSGVLAGLGGVYMSMGYLTFFQRDMTTGRGFIALATPYLGGGNPIGTALASLVFGLFDAIRTRVGSLEIPSQLPPMIPYIATIMALVIYALQAQLRRRVQTLRSSEGAGFDPHFWSAIQRLSVLHMLLAMTAVIGLIVVASMLAAPDGFGGMDEAYPAAFLILLASLALIGINLPFITDVERIGRARWASAGAAVLSLWIYLGLFFMLFVMAMTGRADANWSDALIVAVGFGSGLLAGVLIWLRLGGMYLSRNNHAPLAAT
jgi:simple sugar transport system permease protein